MMERRAFLSTALTATAADALVAAEVSFSGRLGIMHRDLSEMVARACAEVAFTWFHLVSYWARIFLDYFELVAVPGAEPFFTQTPISLVVMLLEGMELARG